MFCRIELWSVLLCVTIFVSTSLCESPIAGYDVPNPANYHKLTDEEIKSIASELDYKLKGHAYPRGSARYEFHRPVHNGACHHLKPYLIAVPYNTDDVSIIVQTAAKLGLETSVRSGGHSFVCQGIKHNSLHIDIRYINHVELVNHYRARFGAGANFATVLKAIPGDHYTLIHGQSLTVGTAGFLQGLGVNPMGTSQRYGFGSEQVVEYTMVLADGSVAKVNKYNTTLTRTGASYGYGYDAPIIVEHGYENDLYFGMRASGGSFGIITEFLYKVYPQPETLSCLLFIFIENEYDFQMLDRAAKDGRYAIAVFQPMIYRKPKSSQLQVNGLIQAPQMMKWQAGKDVEPIFVSVVDLSSPDQKTRAGPAIKFLKSFGLKLAFDNENLITRFGMDRVNLAVPDQESVYLTEEDRLAEGYAGMVSANMNGLKSIKAVAGTFFHHPVFGIYNRRVPKKYNDACDFCLWIVHISKPGVHDNVIADTKIGNYAIELDCTYNAKDPIKSKNCPRLVRNVKHIFNTKAVQVGEKPHQYVNTPSCDDLGESFGHRYWGNSYHRLLKIKKFWDPENFFNHCHSVGSTKEQCCPYDKYH